MAEVVPREYRVTKKVKGSSVNKDHHHPQSTVIVTEHLLHHTSATSVDCLSVVVSIDGDTYRLRLDGFYNKFSLACFIADNLPEPISPSELRSFGFWREPKREEMNND